MIWRLVAWLVIVAFAWWAWRDRSAARRKVPGAAAGAASRGAPNVLAPPEPMVDCLRCGVHLPASEAMRDGTGQPYCCAEHRLAGPRGRA